MDKGAKTTKKRPAKPFTGVEGNKFGKENQPPAEAKKQGWQKLRAQRLLTQKIIEKLTEGKKLDEYVNSLIVNAKMGNSKAIETINKGLEDDIIKIAQTDSEGNDIDFTKYTDDELRTIAELQRKGRAGEA